MGLSTTPGVVTRVAELLSGATFTYNLTSEGFKVKPLPVTKIHDYITTITTGVPLLVGYTLFANTERQLEKDANALSNIYNIPKELYPAILADPNFTKHSPVGEELLRLGALPSSYWKN